MAANRYRHGTPFPGFIGRTVADSVPAWPEPQAPPAGSPNVLIVLLDDVGFAQLGCFGSDIRTPTFDQLAAHGLRYRNFHTTALCTPSRACLLTGRNHHANASGRLPNNPRGFPGYHSAVPNENGFLSEVLRSAGYSTLALGKWHLAPSSESAVGASHARWPLGRGFDRYYGFLGGQTSQWVPDLVYDNHAVPPPRAPDEGYHLNEDLADRAIEFLSDLRAVEPDKPFFMYYCPGAGHEPHHVPREWADRYAGQFDLGWEQWREATFARQLDTGVVPPGTMLSPRPEWIAAWGDLEAEQRRLYTRQMEVYAGFLEHTDHHIGRIVAFLRDLDELDNTLILIASDNGASSDGGPHGRPLAELSTLEDNLRFVDEWGGPTTSPNYSWGWAWAGNTPLRRWKRYLHEGGISDPLIVHWPRGIAARGEVRPQYVHIIDIAPTVLDILGIEAPHQINGIVQSPVHGVSFAHTLHDADAATNKRIQYYEMIASRAIWADGWKAVAEQEPGVHFTAESLAAQRWELYHVADDFSECRDLAAAQGDKLQQLIELWWAEAGRNGVLPLDATWLDSQERERHRRRQYVYYPGAAPLKSVLAADVHNRWHRITAHVEIPDRGAEGVLLAHGGGCSGGYAVYVKDNRLQYVYSYAGVEEHHVHSATPLSSGQRALVLEYAPTGEGRGTAVLKVDGHEVGRGDIVRTMSVFRGQGLCCGYDSGEPVTKRYELPNRFTGTIRRVLVEVGES